MKARIYRAAIYIVVVSVAAFAGYKSANAVYNRPKATDVIINLTAAAYEQGYEIGYLAGVQHCETYGAVAEDLESLVAHLTDDISIGVSALQTVAEHVGGCVMERDLRVVRNPPKVGEGS